MKKYLMVGITLLFSLFFTLSAEIIFAEDEAYIVYAEVPETWEAPHVWAFNEAGDNAYANLGWPGKPMVMDENNPGWYYLYVPSNMDSVIINANEGSVQTSDLAIPDANVWITITEVGESVTAEISESSATSGELPEYVATKYINAYVPIDWDTAGIWAWQHPEGVNVYENWPGAEMSLLDDGWFRTEVPATTNRVIINNFGDTDVLQTIDFEIGEGDSYILIDETPNEDGQYVGEISSEKPVVLGDTFKVTLEVPNEWTEPHIWAWSHPDGTNVYSSWPGEPADYDEEANEFSVLLPTWVNRIIVNNGLTDDNAAQTVDNELLVAEDVTLVVGSMNEEGQYTIAPLNNEPEPEPDPEPELEPEPDPEPELENEMNPLLIAGIVLGVIGVAGGAFFALRKK